MILLTVGGVCSPGHLVLGGGVCSRGCLLPGGSAPGGLLLPGGVPGGDPPRTATAAGGTYPTRMHSCFLLNFSK